jgi:hypothetical protein
VYVLRAVFEGVAERVREALDQVYIDAPELGPMKNPPVGSGATRNELLVQIQADILGILVGAALWLKQPHWVRQTAPRRQRGCGMRKWVQTCVERT